MTTTNKGNIEANGSTAKRGGAIVARTRGAILNTFDAVESRGRVLSEILADEFEKNPLKFMDMAAKYIPKNVDIEVTHNTSADKLTDSDLADIIAKRARAKYDAMAIEGELVQDTDTG